MGRRSDVIEALRVFCVELEETVSAAPDAVWSRQIYRNGWNGRQVLAHIASTSGVAGFALALSRMPDQMAGARASLPARSGGALDQDAWNLQQVALRESRSVEELLGEVRSNTERDAGLVEAASEEELERRFRAPWEIEGPLAEVIVDSVKGHLGVHLADLQAAR